MKLNAVGVTSSNMEKSIGFYTLLGFDFPKDQESESHIESQMTGSSAKLMIDSTEVIKKIIGEDPKPGNHSQFAIEYDTPEEVDTIAQQISDKGFEIIKTPWDAFWGQRYAIVADPDGYKVDLYAQIKK